METSPPNSPTRSLRSQSSPGLRARPSAEDWLSEYISLKCKEKCTRKDFEGMENLRSLPLFQAIQVVHRFNDSVGPRVVNRQAFLVSIIRSTQRWWTSSAPDDLVDGPNTGLVMQLCMTGGLSPDVFTPSVCHALQLLTQEQVVQVAQGFGSNSLALHVANDSYYAKQQLFLSMAHAALMNFQQSTSPTLGASTTNPNGPSNVFLEAPEATAIEAAALGRQRQEASAAAKLPGMLAEFITRSCATSKTIKENDIDAPARDALNRVALIQAMQAIQHFSVSMSDQIVKRSAYLMGVLRGQEQHWERSRAAQSLPGGSKQLLALPPRLLLIIAHLCLDGNCLPSDFSPEVCLELHDFDCDSAIRAAKAFNDNKRIVAGPGGGVTNRVRFFHGLLRNIKQADSRFPLLEGLNVGENTPNSNGNNKVQLNIHATPFVPTSTSLATSPTSPNTMEVMFPTSPKQPSPPTKVALGPSEAEVKLSHLLESSRDAIGFLTSALARSRTSEIRLRKELTECQAQIQRLMSTLIAEREANVKHMDIAKNQIIATISRNFDNLNHIILSGEAVNPPVNVINDSAN